MESVGGMEGGEGRWVDWGEFMTSWVIGLEGGLFAESWETNHDDDEFSIFPGRWRDLYDPWQLQGLTSLCKEERIPFSLSQSSVAAWPHPPLFVDVRRSSNFCEMVVNFYAVSSKRGRFTKAPSLKTSWFPCRGPRVSTIRFLFQLQYFDFLFGEVKRPI